MRQFLLYIVCFSISILLVTCANNQLKEDPVIEQIAQISEVQFYKYSFGLVHDPNELQKNKEFLVVNHKVIHRIKRKYDNIRLIESDTLQTVDCPAKIWNTLNKIPDKYLNKNHVFGSPNMVDEGSLGVTIIFDNDKEIVWELSYYKNQLPKEIQSIYNAYEQIKHTLNK